jgi:hypothetical protein
MRFLSGPAARGRTCAPSAPRAGASVRPLSLIVRRRMRVLLLLLSSVATAGSGADLSDVDVQAIAKATKEFAHAPALSISAADSSCTYTAEADCTREVRVVVGASTLTVSEIHGVWTVGRWQREIVAAAHCLQALRVKWAKEDAEGVPVDFATRREDHAACYGPSGHVGGKRGQ